MEELKRELDVSDHVYIRLLPQKRSLANISLKTKILRLNRDFVGMLSRDELRFVLAHELLHIKYGNVHSLKMRHELLNLFREETMSSTMKKAERFFRLQTTKD